MRRRRPGSHGRRRVAAVVVMVATTGGCSVQVEPDEQARAEEEAAEALFADGLVEIDLRQPPSRADLALPEGVERDVLTPDEGSVQVAVTFTDGTVLGTTAQAVSVSATDETSAPTGLDLFTYGLSEREARARLDAAVTELGTPAGDAELVLRDVFSAGLDGAQSSLPTRVDGDERLRVQVSRSGEPATFDVHYLIAWDLG